MKIAIVGTHGTGKSTLSYLLAAEYKKRGKNVKIVQETARNCPYPVNELMSQEAALWIYYEQSKKELEATHKFEIVICDRSSLDSLIYAKYFKVNYNIIETEKIALNHLKTWYDDVFFVRPDGPLKGDGFRSESHSFQDGIDDIFLEYMKDIDCTEIFSSMIFKEDKWKQFCF